MLSHTASSVEVLAAIKGPGREAITGVREPAGSETGDLETRLTAARTLHDMTGEPGPTLAAIGDTLDKDRTGEWGVKAEMAVVRSVLTVGDPPVWLVPALEATLSTSQTNNRLHAEISRRLCRLTGDVSVLADTLLQSRCLRGPVGGYAIVEPASDCGLSAAPLILDVVKFLNSEVYCPHAVQSIIGAGLGCLDPGILADRLVSMLGSAMGHHHHRPLDLLRQIRVCRST